MKRIWIMFIALILLAAAGCGKTEPSALSESKESCPPAIEIPSQNEETDEDEAIRTGSEESEVNALESDEETISEDVSSKGKTSADKKTASSAVPSSSQPAQKPSEAPAAQTVPQNEPATAGQQAQTPAGEEHGSDTQEDPPARPEPDPEPEPQPDPPQEQPGEPEFDIACWISYAKGVASGKGLRLDSSAKECWDTPITANPDCKYLKREITARLSRYAGDEDITAVWIWYEKIGTNRYLIYIGYA